MEMIIEQMKKISLSEDPLPLLIDMKSNLIAISNREVVAQFETGCPVSHIQPLFDVLNSSNDEQITTCVEVLDYILTKISPKMAVENFMNQYMLCLTHPHEKVRILILKQILKCCDSADSSSILTSHPLLLIRIVNILGDSSMEVAKLAQKVLVQLCSSSPDATQQVFSNEVFEALRRIMSISDSTRFQVYDVVVKISLLSENSLKIMLSSGIINHLIEEVFSGDILTQLSSLELISNLAESVQGLCFLKMDGIVGKFSYLLTSAKNDQMIAVLLPGLLKFFGHLGATYPNILAEEEPLALREVMRISSDFSGGTEQFLQLIAFETLAHIGSSTEGKNALKKFNVEMEQSLRDFSSQFSSFPTEMKVRVLESLTKLFYLPVDQQSEDLLQLLETWFEYLSSKSSMTMLYNVARQPFPDLLCASLTLFLSLVNLPWALEKMIQEPGFFEWLLDRNSCQDKQCKEIRYNIISTIHRHPSGISNILDEDLQRNIEAFFKQGPFYVETELSVALEKEN